MFICPIIMRWFEQLMNDKPCQDSSTIPVLRCFLTGPGYKTVMIFKCSTFDSFWVSDGMFYSPIDIDALFPLGVSGGEDIDDRLIFDFEGAMEGGLAGTFTYFLCGENPDDEEDDAGAGAVSVEAE